MSGFWAGAGSALIGGGLSLAGGLLGGEDKGPSQSQLDFNAQRTERTDQGYLNAGMARQLAAVLGPTEARRFLQGTLPREQFDRLFGRSGGAIDRTAIQRERDTLAGQLAPYRTGTGNGFKDREAYAAGVDTAKASARLRELESMLSTGQDPGAVGEIDSAAWDAQGPGVYSEYQNLATQAGQQGQQVIDQYGRDTKQLLGMSRGVEGLANQYGRGEAERINRDYSRDLVGSNRLTQGTLLGRGLGSSTILTQQLGANAQRNQEGRERALSDLGNRQIDRKMSARGDTVRLLGGRLSGGTQLQMGNQDRTLGMQQQALGLKTNLLTGSTTNPWLGRSTGSYNPGIAPQSQGTDWGNAITGIGSSLLGYGLNNLANGSGSASNTNRNLQTPTYNGLNNNASQQLLG